MPSRPRSPPDTTREDKSTKVVAVGLNYRDHARELGMLVPEHPILFLKPPTSVIGSGQAIVRPAMSGQVDYEAELGIVMKDRISGISPNRRLQASVINQTLVDVAVEATDDGPMALAPLSPSIPGTAPVRASTAPSWLEMAIFRRLN